MDPKTLPYPCRALYEWNGHSTFIADFKSINDEDEILYRDICKLSGTSVAYLDSDKVFDANDDLLKVLEVYTKEEHPEMFI